LVVLDSADAIDHGDDESYLNLEFFLPDAPTVDVIITTRYARAAEMTTLGAVEVGEMGATEAVKLFQKCAKFPSAQPVKCDFAARTCRSIYYDRVVDVGRMQNADELSMPVQIAGLMTSLEGDTICRVNAH
jgi:hypothetical protein